MLFLFGSGVHSIIKLMVIIANFRFMLFLAAAKLS